MRPSSIRFLLTILLIPVAHTILKSQNYSGGSGTLANPYLIANKADLKYLSENSGEWSKHFKQTANIAFTFTDFESGGDFYNSGEGWSPIGTSGTNFTGSYNGDQYTIDSLYINRSTANVGMFGYVYSSATPTLTRIRLRDVSVTGTSTYNGGLCGQLYSGIVTFCSVEGGTVSGGSWTGGVLGYVYTTSSIIHSFGTCDVVGIGSTFDFGGLIGAVNASNSVVVNCYATGDVGGTNAVVVGGLIGYSSSNVDVRNCYSTGAVTGSGSVYGFIGSIFGTTADNFWDTQTSGTTSGSGASGKTTAEMKAESTFVNAGWDTTTVWNVIAGSYPTLRSPMPYIYQTSPLDGDPLQTPSTDLQMSFTELVSAQSGKYLRIYNESDELIEVIPATDGRITFSGVTATIDSDSILPNGYFYVLIDSGAFIDGDSMSFVGITDSSTWNFTVYAPSPTIQTFSPADNDTTFSRSTNFVLTYDIPVTAHSGGYVSIYNSNDVLIEYIPSDDPRITYSTSSVTIDPDSVLPYGDYYVLVDGGAFWDLNLRSAEGVAGKTAWNITIAEPDLSVWGYAMEFGSASDQYGKGNGVVTAQTDDVTLEAWVKWDGTNSGSPQLIVANGHANLGGYGLYLYSDTRFAILVNTLAWHVSDSLLTAGEWTHVAAIRASGTWSLYRNGDSIAIGNPTTVPNSPGGNIFVGGDSTGYAFHGQIDEVRISTIARYGAPFTPPFGPFTPDASTAALYRFVDNGASSDVDASGNGNDLTLYGSPSWVVNDYTESPLTVTTDAATNITTDGGTLNATIETYAVEAFTRFLIGTTSSVYTDSLHADPDTVDADATTQISASISGYVSGQVIYYTAAAWNDRGEYVRGVEQSLTTASSVWKNTIEFGESSSQYAKAEGIVTSITDNLTLEAWVKWDGTNTGIAQVIASNGQAGGAGYGLYLYPDTKIAILLNAVGWFVSDSTLSTDAWTHLAVVRDNGTWSLYKNGHSLPIGVATTNPTTPTGNFFVGGDSVSNYFHGEIDEVRMSDVVRYTESFDPETGPFAVDANTVGLYRFNEGTGTTVGDSSGTGNDLTLINSPSWKASDNSIVPARAVTYAATSVDVSSAIFHGAANAEGGTSDVRFVYGIEPGVYTDSIDASPASVSGIYGQTVEQSVTGLASGTTFYYATATAGETTYDRGDEESFWTTSEVWWYTLAFGGSSSAYAKSNGVATTRTDSVALEAWVKWDGTGSGSAQLIVSNGYSGSDGYGLYLYTDTKLAILISAKAWLRSDSVLTPGVWSHVALVLEDSVTWKLYKDGVSLTLGGDSPTYAHAPSTNLFIGGDSVGNKFQGEIDEVRVSTIPRYLSGFSAEFGPFTNDAGTAALYHFDETNTADASGNARTLTLVNNPSQQRSNNRHLPSAQSAVSDSIAGSALDFTGETSGNPSHYVEVPYSLDLNPADNFSVELWVRAEGGAGMYRSPLGCEQSTSPPQGFYFYAGDNDRWQVWLGDDAINNWNIVNSDDSVLLDTWTHLAMTFSSGTAKFFVNGVLKVTQNDISFNPNRFGVTRIGDIAESPGYVPFNGKIDEVRLWNVVRTQQQIREGMHRTMPSDAWGLVAYYQLNEGTGTTVQDVFGDFPGTITGSPSWVTSSVPIGGGTSVTKTSFSTGSVVLGTVSLTMTDDFDEAVDLVGTQILAAPDATTGISGTPLSDRYWTISSFGNPGAFMANMTFTVPTAFTNNGAAEAAEYTLYHRSGNADGTWSAVRTGATSLTANTVSFDSISSFSQFAIGTGDPLPVQMNALSAERQAQGVVLRWTTVTEVDNSGWEIERKTSSRQYAVGSKEEAEAGEWQVIGFVEGAGTSTSPKEYAFTDNSPITNNQLTRFYRLKQLDRSGSHSYSEEIRVDLEIAPRVYFLSQNYPNPFNPTTTIQYGLPRNARVRLAVFDLLGREVVTLVDEEQSAGRKEVSWDASSTASGIYFYRLTAGEFKQARRLVLLR